MYEKDKAEKLQFDSIHHALEWFFNKRWVKPPADSKTGSLLKIQANPRAICPGRIMETFNAIMDNIHALSPKEQYVIQCEYMNISNVQRDVAQYLGLAGDRSVRDIRDRVIPKLERALLGAKILSKKKVYDPMVYSRMGV